MFAAVVGVPAFLIGLGCTSSSSILLMTVWECEGVLQKAHGTFPTCTVQGPAASVGNGCSLWTCLGPSEVAALRSSHCWSRMAKVAGGLPLLELAVSN